MSKKIQVVDGMTDGQHVSENFAKRYFSEACSKRENWQPISYWCQGVSREV